MEVFFYAMKVLFLSRWLNGCIFNTRENNKFKLNPRFCFLFRLIYPVNVFLTDIGMDVRDMSEFQSGSFNAVIDKGTVFIESFE